MANQSFPKRKKRSSSVNQSIPNQSRASPRDISGENLNQTIKPRRSSGSGSGARRSTPAPTQSIASPEDLSGANLNQTVAPKPKSSTVTKTMQSIEPARSSTIEQFKTAEPIMTSAKPLQSRASPSDLGQPTRRSINPFADTAPLGGRQARNRDILLGFSRFGQRTGRGLAEFPLQSTFRTIERPTQSREPLGFRGALRKTFTGGEILPRTKAEEQIFSQEVGPAGRATEFGLTALTLGRAGFAGARATRGLPLGEKVTELTSGLQPLRVRTTGTFRPNVDLELRGRPATTIESPGGRGRVTIQRTELGDVSRVTTQQVRGDQGFGAQVVRSPVVKSKVGLSGQTFEVSPETTRSVFTIGDIRQTGPLTSKANVRSAPVTKRGDVLDLGEFGRSRQIGGAQTKGDLFAFTSGERILAGDVRAPTSSSKDVLFSTGFKPTTGGFGARLRTPPGSISDREFTVFRPTGRGPKTPLSKTFGSQETVIGLDKSPIITDLPTPSVRGADTIRIPPVSSLSPRQVSRPQQTDADVQIFRAPTLKQELFTPPGIIRKGSEVTSPISFTPLAELPSQRTPQRLRPSLGSAPSQRPKQIPNIGFSPRQDQPQTQRQPPINIQLPKLRQERITRRGPPRFDLGLGREGRRFGVPPLIGIPSGTLRGGTRARKSVRSFERTPSFGAVQLEEFGIKTPNVGKGLEETGLFERPRKKGRRGPIAPLGPFVI